MGLAQDGEAGHQDLTITADTYWTDQTVDVRDLVVASGARLTLEATTLRVGGHVHVEKNASLELNGSNTATRITALDQDGFWMSIEGQMRTHGPSPILIDGLQGTGLESAHSGKGALQIRGQADLQDMHLHGDGAGIIIAEGASVILRDSLIETRDYGIITMGDLRMQDTTLNGNLVGLLGFSTCDVTVEHSRITGGPRTTENLLVNDCNATVRHSVLEGAAVSTAANNRATLEIHNTTIKDYSIDGLGSYASPGPDGLARPIVRFKDVSLEPGPLAQRGADLRGNELAEFVNVTIAGHASHGIRAEDATLHVKDSTITSNGGHGIRLTGGRFAHDPTAAGNHFGDATAGDANGEGAIRHVAVVQFAVVGGGHHVLPGNLSVQVFTAGATDPLALVGPGAGEGTVMVGFDAFGSADDGQPIPLGPFRYHAVHPAGSWQGGPLALDGDPIMLHVESLGAGDDRGAWFLPPGGVVLLALVVLGLAQRMRRDS